MKKTKAKKPRAYTEEEVREKFLNHVRSLVDYWEKDSRQVGARDKLEGLAFSILAALDGCNIGLPAFKVIPLPHKSDRKYLTDRNENYYPTNVDIGGVLHEEFIRNGRCLDEQSHAE